MRTLVFDQITDSRFTDNPAELIRDRKRNIIGKLKALPGVHVEHDSPYKVEFPENVQFRCRFYVQKTGRKTTWNDVYKAVNSVNAAPYRFIDLAPQEVAS